MNLMKVIKVAVVDAAAASAVTVAVVGVVVVAVSVVAVIYLLRFLVLVVDDGAVAAIPACRCFEHARSKSVVSQIRESIQYIGARNVIFK